MKKVLILGAVLFLATTFISFIPERNFPQNANAKLIVLVGSKTQLSTIYAESVTVWITYNPATDVILDISAYDHLGGSLTILDHNADDAITHSGQTIIADDLTVDVNINGYDYVIYNGSFNMI